MYKEKKSKAKTQVAMAKAHEYENLYARLRSCTDWLGRETERGKVYST